jgi:hypothetical protein
MLNTADAAVHEQEQEICYAPVEESLPSVAKATMMVMVMDGLKAVPFNRFFITLAGPQANDSSGRKHFQEWSAELQIPRLPRISC